MVALPQPSEAIRRLMYSPTRQYSEADECGALPRRRCA